MKLAKLLLVEDSQDAADLIIKVLENAGHKVIHKLTALEGLETAQAEPFDGILLDYMLPDMEGLQLCRMIRQSFKEVPIILTSAYLNKVTGEEMVEAGITAFVPKPISENLVLTINKYVTTWSMQHVPAPKEKQTLLQKLFGTKWVV
jgi:two-component system, OmpR family, response regulator